MTHRITVWRHIPAGKQVWNGYPGEYLTAPAEPGFYTLFELADENNCHAGWEWKREDI